MGKNERVLLLNAFDSNWIAPLGPHVDAFENEIANYLDIGHAAALSSGTAALHLALKLAGVKKGDKVLCPSLTFTASANAILYEKAIPVFVDVDLENWTLDIPCLEKAMKMHQVKALIAVDLYGQSCNYDAITALCEKYGISLIEDAAEALGANYKGKKCGTFGRLSILSFNGNKIITTSGGGMLVSDDEDLVSKAQFLATQARESEIHYEHKEVGYNYRMSNLLAAIGRGQLQVLDKRVSIRRAIYGRYFDVLSKVDGIQFMSEASYGKTNRWITTLTVDSQKTGIGRTKIIDSLEKENIESRPVWKPMHMQPLYQTADYILNEENDNSRHLFENGLCLPSGSSLNKKDQGRIIDIILNCINE